jgi:signal transduction histidine kinase
MKQIVFFLFIFCSAFVKAQQEPDLTTYKTSEKKLQAWSDYCDEFLSKQDYTNLRTAARKGKKLTPSTDFYNLSLFDFYIGITFDYATEADSVIFYLEQSEQFARKVNHPRRTTEALKQLLVVYNNYGKKEKKERVVNELLACIDTTKNPNQKVVLFGNISGYYISQGEYETGLSYLLNELKVRESSLTKASRNSDSVNIGVCLINIADLQLKMNNGVKSIAYLKESEPFLKTYIEGVSKVYKTYIDVYLNISNVNGANTYYKKLITYLESAKCISCWYDLLAADLAFSDYYLTKQELKPALIYVKHAQALAPKYADAYMLGDINYITGKVYLQLKEYSSALNYFKKAEPVIKEISTEESSWICSALAEAYSGLGKWDSAYAYQTKYAELKDTLLTEKVKKNIAELEESYQSEKKQQTIVNLSKENTIKNLELINISKQRLFFVVGFLLVFVIGVLVFYQSRLRKKSNVQLQKLNSELDQANKIKARFFSILNHDLRSPVSNLIHFLYLQKEHPELLDKESKTRLETKTINSAKQLLVTMEDLLIWSKGQMQQFKPSFETVKMETLFEAIHNQFENIDSVKLIIENPNAIELQTDLNYLKTIMRNLTSNAYKALEKTPDAQVTWKSWQENTITYLSISDNGAGGTQEQFKALYDETEVVGITTGLGLHLIRDLAKAIHCKITVQTKVEEGTTFVLEIK